MIFKVEKIAKIISRLSDPVFISPIIILLITQLGESQLPWQSIFFLSLIFIYLLPVVAFFVSLTIGRISDWDATKRQERYGLFIFTFLSISLCLVAFYLLEEKQLFYFYLKALMPIFIFFIITFFWKISGHALVNSLLILFIYFYFEKTIILYLGFFLIILVGWSRVFLEKHSWAQVIVGAVLPAVSLLLF